MFDQLSALTVRELTRDHSAVCSTSCGRQKFAL